MARDYDPQNPATADFMALAPNVTGPPASLRSSPRRQRLPVPAATSSRQLYTVIFNGEEADPQQLPRLREGRPLHPLPSHGCTRLRPGRRPLEADGERAGGTATVYHNIAGDVQRATVSCSRGDFTCYTKDDVGRCVVGLLRLTPPTPNAVRRSRQASLTSLFV